jgi:periplasmic protein TonB
LPIANCFYGICKLSHLIAEHGAGFDFHFFISKPNNMNSNFIFKADILDIIFEKRNKEYGAYNLRKFYPNRLKLSLCFMFIIAMLFSAFTILPKKVNLVITKPYEIPAPEFKKIDTRPKEPEKKKELSKPVAKTTAVNQTKHTNNIVVVAKNDKSDTIKTILPTDITGTKNIVNAKPGPFLVEPLKTEPGTGAPEKVTPKIDKSMPMDINAADVPPTYPGGMDALRKFLEKNLHTPDELESGETVSVRVKFVVDYNGKLQSFVIVLDGGEAYNKEVVRVLKKMPDWIPGKAKGENVPVYYTIPVKFVVTD